MDVVGHLVLWLPVGGRFYFFSLCLVLYSFALSCFIFFRFVLLYSALFYFSFFLVPDFVQMVLTSFLARYRASLFSNSHNYALSMLRLKSTLSYIYFGSYGQDYVIVGSTFCHLI